MPFAVFLTEDTAGDLDDLYDYIAQYDTPRKAKYVLKRFEKTFASLAEFPERGAYPKELLALGIREYRAPIPPGEAPQHLLRKQGFPPEGGEV
jgi:toxin ParE1/3/4